MDSEKPKRQATFGIRIAYNTDKSKWWYSVWKSAVTLIISEKFDTEEECRANLKETRAIMKNRYAATKLIGE